jgi:2-iminobutanoate/2-iminopropanoate deaminase
MRQVLNPFPQNVFAGASIPNSAGVRTEQFVFVKGMLGQDPYTREFASDEVRGQTRQIIENVRLVLEAGGSSLEKVVFVLAQVARREDFAAFNEAYSSYFPVDPPARTTMLTEMLIEGALVELTVTALA